MQIVEIENKFENDPNKSSDQNNEIVVGIDFGTTNSIIAYSVDKAPRSVILNLEQEDILPSIISITNSGAVIVGKKLQAANTIRSIKRLLAKSFDQIKQSPVLSSLAPALKADINQQPYVFSNERKLSITELASFVIRHLKETAERDLKKTISRAVISVPAYFNNDERGQVMLAAKLAGLEVLRLIAEPTAAAYAYGVGHELNRQGNYLVYDLGGGTFDVSILSIQDGVVQVIATDGDNNLGGDDLDFDIAKFVAKKYGFTIEEVIPLARSIKEYLSNHPSYKVEFQGALIDVSDREANKACADKVNKTIKITKNVIGQAREILEGQSDEEFKIENIILVGGSTKMPAIKNLIEQEFGKIILDDIDPDRAVAFGAAMQAENLTRRNKKGGANLLLDVLPLSVGLELYGGIFEKIILRNSSIPIAVSKEFTTQVENQNAMNFHVLQGEREFAKDCRSLAKFELSGLRPMPAGRVKVRVTFAIDADGVLSVTAEDSDTHKIVDITVKPTYGQSPENIEKMLEEAFAMAREDHVNRLLAESKDDAIRTINGIKNAIASTPDILTKQDLVTIEDAILSLQNSLSDSDRDLIELRLSKLNKLAESFIEKHLNFGAKSILKGKKITQI